MKSRHLKLVPGDETISLRPLEIVSGDLFTERDFYKAICTGEMRGILERVTARANEKFRCWLDGKSEIES